MAIKLKEHNHHHPLRIFKSNSLIEDKISLRLNLKICDVKKIFHNLIY